MRGDAALPSEPPTGANAGQTHCIIPGTAEAVRELLQSLVSGPLGRALSPEQVSNLEIVLAEVLNNVVEHAYAAFPGRVCVTLRREGADLRCEVCDQGAAMPGLDLPAGRQADLAEIADLPEGGFGWFLIRSLTQDLTYRRDNGVNHLSFLLPARQLPH